MSHELRDLPRAARREVLEEVAGHIEEARAESSVETEADVLNVLERVGAPEEIAGTANAAARSAPCDRSDAYGVVNRSSAASGSRARGVVRMNATDVVTA